MLLHPPRDGLSHEVVGAGGMPPSEHRAIDLHENPPGNQLDRACGHPRGLSSDSLVQQPHHDLRGPAKREHAYALEHPVRGRQLRPHSRGEQPDLGSGGSLAHHIDHEVEQGNGVAPGVARRLGKVAVEQDGSCLPQPVGQTGLVACPGSGHRPAPSRCRRPPAERRGCVIRHEAERRSSRICRYNECDSWDSS